MLEATRKFATRTIFYLEFVVAWYLVYMAKMHATFEPMAFTIAPKIVIRLTWDPINPMYCVDTKDRIIDKTVVSVH